MPPKGYRKPNPKKRQRVITVNLYLGPDEDRERRKANLHELAQVMGVKNAARLVQLIADGDIKLVRVLES